MILPGYAHIEIAVYMKSIQLTVQCHYTDTMNRPKFMLEYFSFYYPNRFWRFLFEKDLIEKVKDMATEIGLDIGTIRNVRVIEQHDSGFLVKNNIAMDLRKNKGIEL